MFTLLKVTLTLLRGKFNPSCYGILCCVDAASSAQEETWCRTDVAFVHISSCLPLKGAAEHLSK